MNLQINKNIKIAVVILNWNGKEYLEKFLPALINHSKSKLVEIYVADNGSTDNSVNFLQSTFPEIQIIILDKNYGFAGGYNKVLAQINAKYYVILNSDVEVTENWIFPIIDKMDTDNSVAAAMPKIKSYQNKDYYEYAGAAGGFIDKYGYPFCRGRILDKIEKDSGQYNYESEIFWASGACLFIRSEVYHNHNGFDEDFFAHMEEIDLCWRIKNTGHKIMFYPDSEVFHVGGGALPNNSPQKLYLNYRNNLFLLYKNLPSNNRFKIVFIRMFLDGASAMVYLSRFSTSFFFAVLKAHFSFYTSIKRLRNKRKQLTVINNKYHHKEIYKQSILYNYFVKKVRTYKNLLF